MGVTENSPKVLICCSVGKSALVATIKSFNRMRGEDPTIVIVPPRIAQKPIGISRRAMPMFVREEIRETTGRKRAAAPTFCIKLEIKPTVLEMIGMIRHSVVPPYFRIVAATLVIRPVLSNPAPMIITAIIEMTALEAKPSNK